MRRWKEGEGWNGDGIEGCPVKNIRLKVANEEE